MGIDNFARLVALRPNPVFTTVTVTSGVTVGGTISASNLSGTNTGDQTNITGNAGSATVLQTGRTIGMTGDVVWTSPAFNGSGNVTAVATIQPNVVINGDLAQVATATFKGRTSAGIGNVEDLTVAQAKALLNLSGTGVTDIGGNAATATALQTGRTLAISGDLTWNSGTFNGTGNVTAVGTLATVNSNVGSYGSTSAVPIITVNGKGLVTAVSTAALGTAAIRNTGTSGNVLPFLDGGNTWSGAQTFSALTTFATPTTALSSINLPHGVAPTTPNNGDMWSTTGGVFVRVSAATKQYAFTDSSITGNAATATALQTGRTLGITGDLVWTSPTFNGSGNVTAAGTIQANVVDNTKLAQVPTATFHGRTTAGTGNVENLTVAQAKALLNLSGTGVTDIGGNAATATALQTGRTLGITGDLVWTSPTFNGSGNVTAAGTIQANVVDNTKLAQVPTATFHGRTTAGTGNVENLTVAQAKALLNLSGTGVTDIGGNAGSATVLQTGRTLAITGDLVWTSPTFNGSGNVTAAGTLATVNSNVGTFGSGTVAPIVTVNAKGLVTAVSTTTITPAFSSITGLPTTVAGYGITNAALSTGQTFTGPVVLAADPVTALGAATKQYVDNVAANLDPKGSVLCATTGNVTLSGEQTIDGVLTSASRVLVKNNTNAAENGIYVTSSGAWIRASDLDTWLEVPGAYMFIEQGTTQGDTSWVCTSNSGGTLGTTPMTWTQFSGAGTYSANGGITLTTTNFALTNMPALTFKANNTGSTAAPLDITATQATAMLDLASGSAKGLMSASDFTKLAGIAAGAQIGTVTSVSVTTANGISGSVATSTSTPAITLTLGAITPSSVAAVGTVTGSNLSGTNTGDQTTITGNAGSATVLQTGRTLGITGDLVWTSPTFNGSGNVTAAGTIQANVVDNTKLAQVPTATFHGRTTAGTGNVENLTVAQAKALLNLSGTGVTDIGGNAATATALQTGRTLGITGDLVWTSPTFNGSGNVTAAGTIQANVVDNTKLAQVPTATFHGRTTAGTGNVENLTVAQAKALLNLSGTGVTDIGGNAGSATVLQTGRTLAITGDLVWTSPTFNGSGNVTAAGTIQNNVVTNAKLAQVATATIKGRTTAGTGNSEDLTGTQATALLDVFTTTAKGLVPAPGTSNTTDFLRRDGTWSTPAGAGTVTSVAMSVPVGLNISGSPITGAGTLAVTLQAGYSIPTTASQTNWDTAFTDRNKWDGGATGLTAATGRISLGLGSSATVNTGTSGATIPLLNGANTWSSAQTFTSGLNVTSGSVGIGTASPSQPLEVIGTIKAGTVNGVTLEIAKDSAIRNTSNTAAIMYFDVSTGGAAQGSFVFRSSSSYNVRFAINDNGNVGVGVAAPADKFHVFGGNTRIENTSYPKLIYNSSSNGVNLKKWQSYVDPTGNYRIAALNDAENAEITSFFFGSNGYLGIGTSSPQRSLDIQSSTTTSSGLLSALAPSLASTNFVEFNIGKSFSSYQCGVLGYSYNATGANSFTYLSNFGDAGSSGVGLVVRSGGSIGIGTTTPQGLLHVVAGADRSLLFRGPVNLSDGGSIYSVNSANNALRNLEFAGSLFYFAGGSVGIGTTTPKDSLDVRSGFGVVVAPNNYYSSNLYYDGSWKYIANGIGGMLKPADSTGGLTYYYTAVNASGANAAATPIIGFSSFGGNFGVGMTSPSGKLHVSLSTGFSWGGAWSSGCACFGGSGSTSGTLALSYDDTNGGVIGSIIPGVAWKPVRTYSDFVSLCHSGSTEGLKVSSGGTNIRAALFLGPSGEGLVQHNGVDMFIRPLTSSGNLFLGNNNVNYWYLDINGHWVPTNDNARDLGSGSNRCRVLYAATGSINTSDQTQKDWRELPPTEIELDAAWDCFQELGFYQWKDSVAEKGAENARFHFGLRAQRVWNIFAGYGLVDPIDENGRPGKTPYALFCYDEWDAKHKDILEEVEEIPAVINEETGMVVQAAVIKQVPTGEKELVRPAGSRFGFRPDQLDRLMMAALKRQSDRQDAKLRAMELFLEAQGFTA